MLPFLKQILVLFNYKHLATLVLAARKERRPLGAASARVPVGATSARTGRGETRVSGGRACIVTTGLMDANAHVAGTWQIDTGVGQERKTNYITTRGHVSHTHTHTHTPHTHTHTPHTHTHTHTHTVTHTQRHAHFTCRQIDCGPMATKYMFEKESLFRICGWMDVLCALKLKLTSNFLFRPKAFAARKIVPDNLTMLLVDLSLLWNSIDIAAGQATCQQEC